MRIQQWLKDVVCDPSYRKLIWWHNEEKQLIAIHWKHASFDDYSEYDSVLFKKWAEDNNRYDPCENDTREEIKRWKTNFRCALHSATNIKPGVASDGRHRKGKRSFKVYELLTKPDPDKVSQKQKNNKRAAESKLKPNSQKRTYNSRLNRIKTEVKIEPMVVPTMYKRSPCNIKSKRRPSKNIPKFEPVSMDDIIHEAPACVTTSPYVPATNDWAKSPAADELPVTLEQFHEEERGDDSGYFSASDSQSVSSQDQSSVSSSEESMSSTSTQDYREPKAQHVRLDSVETIFRRDVHQTISNGSPLYSTMDFCESDFCEDGNIFYRCGEWGTEIVDEFSNTPNVTTQLYANLSVSPAKAASFTGRDMPVYTAPTESFTWTAL